MKMRVADIVDDSAEVKVFTLRHPLRDELPVASPGSHVDVHLLDGKIRQYSLCGDPDEKSQYKIAVKREPGGRGGSRLMHEAYVRGSEIHVSAPRNNFPLEPTADRHILVAGGIGITPFISMAHHLSRQGAEFELHYASRQYPPPLMASLLDICGSRLNIYSSNSERPRRFDPKGALSNQPPGTHIYACGPQALMDAVSAATSEWPSQQVHFEAFQATLDENFKAEPFDIRIASTGSTIRVPADQSALCVLRDAGFLLPASCEMGVCGSCECGYRDGSVIHRDKVLKIDARQDRMMLCVSRARVSVTLDL